MPAIELLGSELQVLPANGGAVEYMQWPDVEEKEDRLIHAGEDTISAFLEDPEPSPSNLYRPTPPIHRADMHFFRYFIDGSLRTYFLATAVANKQSFPIELAQIGAAVIERFDDGRVRVLDKRHQTLLLVPKSGGNGVPDTVYAKLEKMSDPTFKVIDYDIPDVLNRANTIDPRNKAGAKARNRMHQLEIDLIQTTKAFRDEEKWLILDGAVKLDQFIKAPYLIGAAKSFRKDPEFFLGKGKNPKRMDITSVLAGLPEAHRTVAFSTHNGQVAFWYVRMREQKQLDYPLMGVVKVELPRPDRTPVSAELADKLSSCLVAERTVAPHGRDVRWHNHLYPIFIAEQAIKSGFYSREVLLGAIRWPARTP